MTRRSQVLKSIASEIERLSAASSVFVGIDGVDGVGKTCFADELAARFGSRSIIRASVDDFHNPRKIRYLKGKDSPTGFFEDSFDYAGLKQLLFDPLRHGRAGSVYYRKLFDHRLDRAVDAPPEIIPDMFVLIFDGIFLHRPELVEYWDYTVFLDAPRTVTIKRCVDRAGVTGVSTDPHHPIHRRYVAGQNLYLDSCDPRSLATKVVDNEIIEYPRVVD